jgi:hypothetical protein
MILFILAQQPEVTGCIDWPFTVTATGYGSAVWWDGAKKHTTSAHRLAYVLLVGSIAPGQQIDHLCRNRLCVNIAHLEQVDARTNTSRSNARSAATLQAQDAAGTCSRGHEWIQGSTQCQDCSRASQRRRESSIRAARQALGLSRREYTARYGRSGRVARSLVDAADV